MGQGCGSGSWKRLNFCESRSTLKKEAGSGSKLRSDKLYTELEAEAKLCYFFHTPEHVANLPVQAHFSEMYDRKFAKFQRKISASIKNFLKLDNFRKNCIGKLSKSFDISSKII